MFRIFCLILVFFFTFQKILSQDISAEMIHSISFQKHGENKSSNFLIGKINDRFLISFDVLSGIEYDLYYIIEHCDYNWEKSKLLKSEYIEGFDDVKITNYTSSFNTYQIYTNYNINFPNPNTSIKKSGNYIIRIFDEYGEELFNRKFIIYENLSSVKVDIKRSKELKNINEKQIVNFEVNPNNIRFNNPDKNVKTLVFKNSNIDSPITNVKPQYKIGNKLIYKYDKELSFWGGNEYLYFDNKNIRITNVKIRGYNLKEIYENYLFNDYPRFNRKYTYNPDINGGFLINASNSGNSNNEADYANIYFTLENYNNYLNNDQDIYIVGDFNNYSTNKIYKMQFNENKNQFEAVLKLKQGFYNYKYLIDNEIYENDNKSVGGNFDETENVYSVLVYYRDYGERYDRIVGFGKGSSEFITN